MKILVTGATGFVGAYLVKALASRGHEVIAGLFSSESLHPPAAARTVNLDTRNPEDWGFAISEYRPEAVIHLAAQSMVARSWEQPAETLATNTLSVLHMINSVRSLAPDTRMISVGSSEEYGLAGKSGQLLAEDSECLPQNPYAVSKHTAGQLALQYARKDGLNLLHLRPFNHFGPGQPEGFVISDYCSQISRIEKGRQSAVMKIGDLSARRDFTDVRDVVDAYVRLLESPVPSGIYNICSGHPRQIREILDTLLNMAYTPVQVEIDEARLRPSEVPLFAGSSKKIRAAVNWVTNRDFTESLEETLNWWRMR